MKTTDLDPIDQLIQPTSWLGLARKNHDLRDGIWLTGPISVGKTALKPTLQTPQRHPGVVVAVDGGNGGAKIAVARPQTDPAIAPRLLIKRIPACVASYKPVRTGAVPTRYQIDAGETIVIGQPEIDGSKEITTGSTAERFGQPLYRTYLFAAIVDTLVAAGYQPRDGRALPIYIGYAVPGEEIEHDRLAPATAEALKTLGGATVEVLRWCDGQNTPTRWLLSVVGVRYAPQSAGVAYALRHSPGGEIVLNLKKLTTYDLGYGHSQVFHTTVLKTDTGERMSTTGGEVGVGLKMIAEQIVSSSRGKIGIVEAQHVLIHGERIDGTPTSAAKDAVHAIAAELFDLADTDVFKARGWLVVTGGGAAQSELRQEIVERLKRSPRGIDYSVILPCDVAPFANAIGIYAIVYKAFKADAAKIAM